MNQRISHASHRPSKERRSSSDHSISAAEDLSTDSSPTVSIRLCAYKTPDIMVNANSGLILERSTL